MEILIPLTASLVLLLIGYFIGTILEKKHYQSINDREEKFINLPSVTMTYRAASKETDMSKYSKTQLVSGGVVVSIDYFKRFLALLRNFFGGRVSSYETLVDRARREAILRMKEQSSGADMIINVRLETSTISSSAGDSETVDSIEAFAYGTALYK
ncbi:MAG: heavy metal-binding domain-containing protein [Candidatus Caenarcaniphilales bacterium]|nr:heavy metal-binding domain-containing protein [Candidatus Caenarcaniphilales bacterium]